MTHALLPALLLALSGQFYQVDTDGDGDPDAYQWIGTAEWRLGTSVGSSGQCLCSNGSAASPSWQTVSGGGGGGYATVQDEGTPLTQRATINFIGAALTAADNAGSSRTDVTLSQSPASASVVGTGRTITAGTGLTGGGDLSADRSIALDSTALLDNQARVMVRANTGSNVGPRRRLNFIQGTGITINPVDAPATEEVNITIATTGVVVGPGSSTDNAITRWDGAGGASVQNSTVLVDDSGRLTLPPAATPSAPSAGNAAIYVRNLAGRPLPATLAPLGAESWLQPSLGTNNIALWLPGVTTTAGINFGVSWTVIATQSHPAQASTNFLTAMRRAQFQTTTTIGNGSGVRAAANTFWRGNAAGLGGFFFFARVGVVTFQSAMQIAVCLLPTAALGGEPSAVNNHICLRKDSTDTNWFFSTRNGTTATPVDLGLAVAAGQVLDLYVWAGPNASDITYRVERIDSASVLANNVTTSSTLPVSTTFIAPSAQVRTTTANAVAIALAKIYVESNY